MWGRTAHTATPPVPVASHATTVASYTPVCPTMSGGARLHMTNGYLPLFMASTIWVGGRGVFGCVNKLAPSLVLVHSRDGDGSHPSSLPCARSLKGWRRQPPLIPPLCSFTQGMETAATPHPSLVLVHSRDGDGNHPSSLPCARSLKGWRRQPPLIPPLCSFTQGMETAATPHPSLVLVHSRDGDGSHPSSLPCARSLKGWRRQPPLIPPLCSFTQGMETATTPHPMQSLLY